MKVHKVVLLVLDTDGIGAESVRYALESQRYPNRCIAPSVMQLDTVEVEWSDDHPLNNRAQQAAAFAGLFP